MIPENKNVSSTVDRKNQMDQAEKTRVAMSERERILQADRRARAAELGTKLRILFGLQIAILCIAALVLVIAFAATAENAESALKIVIISAIASLVLSVVYCATVISMGKFDEEFSGAGALFIASSICSAIKSFVGSGNAAASLLTLVGSALSVGYMLKFSAGMINSCEAINSGLADDWESYKKAYLIATIGSICCVVVAIMPGLIGLAMIGSFCFAIMGIVVGIWMIILLYNSSVEMTAFSLSPIVPSKTSGAGAFRNLGVGSSRSSSAPVAASKTSMSREAAIKKAEEMRLHREGKTSGSETPVADTPAKTELIKEQQKIDMLKKYKELLDSGAITEEEFAAKKKELL